MVKVSLRAVGYGFSSLLVFAGLLSAARPVFADSDVDALRQQVEALTHTVGALSRRVAGLEQKLDSMEQGRRSVPPQAATPKPPPPPPATATAAVPPAQRVAPGELVPPTPPKGTAQGNMTVGEQAAQAAANYKPTPRESWAQLKEGMSEAQVTALLGVPTRKFEAGGQTVWYYYYRDVGSGSVFFYQDGHVASRQRPPFGGWHW